MCLVLLGGILLYIDFVKKKLIDKKARKKMDEIQMRAYQSELVRSAEQMVAGTFTSERDLSAPQRQETPSRGGGAGGSGRTEFEHQEIYRQEIPRMGGLMSHVRNDNAWSGVPMPIPLSFDEFSLRPDQAAQGAQETRVEPPRDINYRIVRRLREVESWTNERPYAITLGPNEMYEFLGRQGPGLGGRPNARINGVEVLLGGPGINIVFADVLLYQRFIARPQVLGEQPAAPTTDTLQHAKMVFEAKNQIRWFEEQVKKMQDETHNFDNGAFIAEYYKKFNQGVRE